MTETQVAENPLLEGLGPRRTPEPCVLVIFGASGDLTRRKIFPALYALACRRLLPERFAIVGAARSDWTDEEFRDRMEHAVREFGRDDFKQEVWDWLAEATHYLSMDFADESRVDELTKLLNRLDEERGASGNRVYYLAVPPRAMPAIVEELGKRRKTQGWTRLIVEKPFGHDLSSARELSRLISRYFTEPEVFRIDHYLGKETVQNVLALRFANGIFEPIWNRQFVDHIQITVAETIGIEGRAEYYESAGAVRDIFQNHMLQLVALTAMEPPIDFTADSVRNEILQGGYGADLLIGGSFGQDPSVEVDDVLFGGPGPDDLRGGPGRDNLSGDTGNDVLRGGPDSDILLGGPGDDRIFASGDVHEEQQVHDIVRCGPGRHDVAFVDRIDRVAGCETIHRR